MTSACDNLKAACKPIWDDLHAHPFIEEMVSGTLPETKFAFYIGQNILYLREFAKAAAIGIAKSDDEETMRLFSRIVASTIDFELPENRALRDRIRSLAPDAAGDVAMAPATLAYTRHLLTVAYNGRPVDIMASITPCVWSYGEIGKQRVAKAPDHPVYGEWIAFFAGREYWDSLIEVKAKLDSLCADLSTEDYERVESIFRTSSRLERMFWDAAYQEQDWPV